MPDLPRIIGLGGYAATGKDTLANLLAERHGYRVAHFADGVRKACRRLNPILNDSRCGLPMRWASAEVVFGYAEAKFHPVYGQEFRAMLQRMGTEVGRDMFGADCWVDALDRTISPDERVVVADVRFPNEVDWVERVGGLFVKIHRSGVGPLNDHASETSLDGISALVEILNDGTPADMLAQLESRIAARKAVTA